MLILIFVYLFDCLSSSKAFACTSTLILVLAFTFSNNLGCSSNDENGSNDSKASNDNRHDRSDMFILIFSSHLVSRRSVGIGIMVDPKTSSLSLDYVHSGGRND